MPRIKRITMFWGNDMATLGSQSSPRQILDDVMFEVISEGIYGIEKPDNVVLEPDYSRQAFYEELVLGSNLYFSDPEVDRDLFDRYVDRVHDLAKYGLSEAKKAFYDRAILVDEYEVARAVGGKVAGHEAIQACVSIADWRDAGQLFPIERDRSHLARIGSSIENDYRKSFDRIRTPTGQTPPISGAEQVMTIGITCSLVNHVSYLDQLFSPHQS